METDASIVNMPTAATVSQGYTPSTTSPSSSGSGPSKLDKFAGFLHLTDTVLRLQLSLPIVSDNANVEAALEESMPHTLGIELGMDIPMIGYDGLIVQPDQVRWTLSPHFNYLQNVHLNTKDSYSLQPGLGTKVQLLTPYVQPYLAGQYTFTHQKFRNPTLFYANKNDHEFQAELGANGHIYKDYLTLTPYFAYRYDILNHEYPNTIRSDYSYKGEEESVYMGAYLALTLRQGKNYVEYGQANPEGLDKRWIPNFGFHFDINFYGRTHIPSTLEIGQEIVWDYQKAMKLNEWSIGGTVDADYLIASFTHENRKVEGWPAETHTGVELQVRLSDVARAGGIGKINLGYDNYNVNPTTPLTIHKGSAAYVFPFFNEALSLGGFGYGGDVKGGGGMLSVDVPPFFYWAADRN